MIRKKITPYEIWFLSVLDRSGFKMELCWFRHNYSFSYSMELNTFLIVTGNKEQRPATNNLLAPK